MRKFCTNQTLVSASVTLLVPFPTSLFLTWVGLFSRHFSAVPSRELLACRMGFNFGGYEVL